MWDSWIRSFFFYCITFGCFSMFIFLQKKTNNFKFKLSSSNLRMIQSFRHISGTTDQCAHGKWEKVAVGCFPMSLTALTPHPPGQRAGAHLCVQDGPPQSLQAPVEVCCGAPRLLQAERPGGEELCSLRIHTHGLPLQIQVSRMRRRTRRR